MPPVCEMDGEWPLASFAGHAIQAQVVHWTFDHSIPWSFDHGWPRILQFRLPCFDRFVLRLGIRPRLGSSADRSQYPPRLFHPGKSGGVAVFGGHGSYKGICFGGLSVAAPGAF